MDDLPQVVCPVCDAHFNVIWSRTYEGEKPEYCPMCGSEFDYRKATDE